jgi:surface polysaccharide O-acyltransferase-like enzyme
MKRNYGIDFLRILSMFMVVILHVLGQGGILKAAAPNSLTYWVAWLLEISCYCAVNCFALISGYVMYHSSAKVSKALGLWLQTFFYTILALLLFLVLKPEVIGIRVLVNAAFPITRKHYWYVSSYFGLLVLSPLLNSIIAYTQKKLLGAVLFVIWLLFSVLPHALYADPYALIGGYSVIWLALLYLAGGYIGKYDVPDKIKNYQAWLVVAVMIILTFLSKFVLENFPQHILHTAGFGNALITYTSPSIALIAIMLLSIFSKQRFGKWGVTLIGILAPASLGVYLIHTNELVWRYFIADLFSHFIDYHCIVMVLLILLSAAGIYAVCTIIELIRIRLFKLLKVDKLCNKAEAKLVSIFNNYSNV